MNVFCIKMVGKLMLISPTCGEMGFDPPNKSSQNRRIMLWELETAQVFQGAHELLSPGDLRSVCSVVGSDGSLQYVEKR